MSEMGSIESVYIMRSLYGVAIQDRMLLHSIRGIVRKCCCIGSVVDCVCVVCSRICLASHVGHVIGGLRIVSLSIRITSTTHSGILTPQILIILKS